MHTETLAAHAGRDDFVARGIHAPPLDFSSTYPLPDLDEAIGDLDRMLEGKRPEHTPFYSRLASPTVDRYEGALARLEGAADAVAFSSGMAAITATILAAAQRGRHTVGVRPLYGGTDHLLECGLLGVEVTWAEARSVHAAIRDDTGLVIIETPGNPTLQLVDIEDVVRQAGRVPVLVDSTFATPILQQPLRHGATFALHSATKYLGGHGDVLGGIVATSDEWAAELRKVRAATGAVLHPMAAFLLHRSLPTLPFRVREAQARAIELARRLRKHPLVERVHFPDGEAEDPRGLIGTQMAGPGSVIALEVRGGFLTARRVMESVRLITPAVSLGSTDTLIEHPAALTHRICSDEGRTSGGIVAGLLRLAVGLEHVDDLWADLESALAAAAALVHPEDRLVNHA
jgi:methionine-gamma-lyase